MPKLIKHLDGKLASEGVTDNFALVAPVAAADLGKHFSSDSIESDGNGAHVLQCTTKKKEVQVKSRYIFIGGI